jgi:hypothetical protein
VSAVWYCPECEDYGDAKWGHKTHHRYDAKCIGTPIDLIAERDRYQAHVVVLEGKIQVATELIDSLQAENERMRYVTDATEFTAYYPKEDSITKPESK